MNKQIDWAYLGIRFKAALVAAIYLAFVISSYSYFEYPEFVLGALSLIALPLYVATWLILIRRSQRLHPTQERAIDK